MANMTISFTVPSEHVSRIVDAEKGLYPIPTTTDEEGVTTNDFTDNQWAKESLRRLVVRDVRRWENKVAREAAGVESDDSIIS